MKAKLVVLLQTIFGVCLMYAVMVGAVVFLIYLAGFDAGGNVGTSMAILGAKIMNGAITMSALGAFVGIFAFYIEDTHELTMAKK
jgi:hypothetical protein